MEVLEALTRAELIQMRESCRLTLETDQNWFEDFQAETFSQLSPGQRKRAEARHLKWIEHLASEIGFIEMALSEKGTENEIESRPFLLPIEGCGG